MAVPDPIEPADEPRAPRATLEAGQGTIDVSPEPSLPELDLSARLVLGASIATDIAVRTALASAISAMATPWVLTMSARRERERLQFYRELAAARDPEIAFPRPAEGVEISTQRAAPWSFRAAGGHVSVLRFESAFTAVNPALRDEYARYRRNGIAWAQHWRHDDGPRPTLCVIHGFGASPYVINSAFFALPWLYRRGFDVLLYLMPFHGPRRAGQLSPNGSGLFAHGPSHFNEAIAHTVHDFRVFVDYLFASGVSRVGVTGLSLGGYMSALLAAVEVRLRVAIPNAAVVSIERLVPGWFPANVGLAIASWLQRIPVEEAREALAVHSPLSYPPLLPKERLMIIGGLGDRLAPPEQSRLLWEHWGQPRLHWYPGNHILHVNRAAYLREMRRFMEGAGLGVGAGPPSDARA